jgi:hypothetical protein
MKYHAPEMDDGPDAFERFRRAVRAVLLVPKGELPPRPTRNEKRVAERKS